MEPKIESSVWKRSNYMKDDDVILIGEWEERDEKEEKARSTGIVGGYCATTRRVMTKLME